MSAGKGMAKVWLNMMECAGGHLPECCIVCGSEEDIEYLEREMEYRPPWPTAFLGLHFIGWHLIGGFLGWFSERFTQLLFTKFPYCPDHYGDWDRRDRRQHLGVLVIALGWMGPMIATFVLNNNMRMSTNALAVGISATFLGLVVVYSLGFKAIHVAGVKTTRVLIADVHPDFKESVQRRRET